VREAPKLERTVRGIHTIDGGSRPLPAWYIFRASVSDYSWWLIIDRLLFMYFQRGWWSETMDFVTYHGV